MTTPISDHWVVSVAVPRPLDSLFTYSVPESVGPLAIGDCVAVPFGRSQVSAVVIRAPERFDPTLHCLEWGKVKPVLHKESSLWSLPADLVKLGKFASDYYHAPIGEVFRLMVPQKLIASEQKREVKRELKAQKAKDQTKKRKKNTTSESLPEPVPARIESFLTEDQLRALDALRSSTTSVSLLHGVTGSGKTEVYAHWAREFIQAGKSVLILVPEIALTPQLQNRFQKLLGTTVGLWHSALAEGKKQEVWTQLRTGQLKVLVGARSAVFLPMPDLGLTVIDEEHDSSYKQEEQVRYHARDLAIYRAHLSQSRVVLGSATPSFESLRNAEDGKYQLVRLQARVFSRPLPEIELVTLDPRATKVEGFQTRFSPQTLDAVRTTLTAGEQVILFQNRRGFASFLMCGDCREVRGCPHCSISLTVHQRGRVARCHWCEYSESTPDSCWSCSGTAMVMVGSGTESLELELPQLIPEARPTRLDRDQITSHRRLTETLDDFRSGKFNVLMGTQMLAKGHDFPNVTLVVVLMADGLFRWPDFRSSERAYQLLTQVSGRAGRSDRAGKVLIQTYSARHPVLDLLTGKRSWEDWYCEEMEMRKMLCYPPFGRMARIRMEGKQREQVQSLLIQAVDQVEREFPSVPMVAEILGPTEALVERAHGLYRWDVVIKALEISALQKRVRALRRRLEALSTVPQRLWIDIDPQSV